MMNLLPVLQAPHTRSAVWVIASENTCPHINYFASASCAAARQLSVRGNQCGIQRRQVACISLAMTSKVASMLRLPATGCRAALSVMTFVFRTNGQSLCPSTLGPVSPTSYEWSYVRRPRYHPQDRQAGSASANRVVSLATAVSAGNESPSRVTPTGALPPSKGSRLKTQLPAKERVIFSPGGR